MSGLAVTPFAASLHALHVSAPQDLVEGLLSLAAAEFRKATDATWLVDVCREVDATITDRSIQRQFASDLAWWVRRRRDDDVSVRREPDGLVGAPLTYVEFIARAQYLRYDYRFRALEVLVQKFSDPSTRTDSLVNALQLFAHLGLLDASSFSGGGDVVVETSKEVSRIFASPDCDNKVLHCLVHALTVNSNPRPLGGLIIQTGRRVEERLVGPPDPNLHYRLATGYRYIGDYENAASQIRRALALPPPDNAVHAQYQAEMAAILLEKSVLDGVEANSLKVAAKIDELQDQTLDEINETLRAGLTANFQILSIFVALAAFLGTAGATVAAFAKSEVTALRAIIALTIITAFLCIMLLASRWIVSYRRRPRRMLKSRS